MGIIHLRSSKKNANGYPDYGCNSTDYQYLYSTGGRGLACDLATYITETEEPHKSCAYRSRE